ncbi:RNA-directed DNA polymerase (reverse transcriptase)-related family protein [Arabidopsis thaliana]|uniref:RNA-directed DNA polymerase (Reverse transcriptase)-related family protein n=1 Tax=Arabidopsis thaliana TaxID=3702 RepID=Q3E713_ARATH|nr:RNA-directed DNA polymerase (reverse transcriptase)-related family protein [Arabidopsis thaliana]AED93817.1 RNA-directed DNA polymerase (reverse transcriptase)-related family protein [Arabidopsis thaliana]|eukprot:NP_680243.1 RNA-directed DNA polymerase (reverse transcriptase)-related family protein [Arabidopsis thaliana]
MAACSGITAKFWHDDWTGLGPLIDLTAPLGPQFTGLSLDVVVRDVVIGYTWRFSTSRSKNHIINMLKNILPNPENMIESQHDDSYLWKADHHAPSNIFSAAKTWLALYTFAATVPWNKSVWFKGNFLKHAFISWVVTWNRLHTHDKLRN